MMMIAFITFKSSLVPLFEGLWSSKTYQRDLLRNIMATLNRCARTLSIHWISVSILSICHSTCVGSCSLFNMYTFTFVPNRAPSSCHWQRQRPRCLRFWPNHLYPRFWSEESNTHTCIMRVWKPLSLAPATICMVLVIRWIDLTDATRRRSCLRVAMPRPCWKKKRSLCCGWQRSWHEVKVLHLKDLHLLQGQFLKDLLLLLSPSPAYTWSLGRYRTAQKARALSG